MTDAAAAHEPGATGIRRSIPNLLTISRIVMAVAFFAILTPIRWSPDDTGVLIGAMVLFVVAALTDAADGYLARRWRVISQFGRVMDPFADKLLVIGAFVLLAAPGFEVEGRQISGVESWMILVILGRELLVTSIRGVLESQGISFPATWSGKWKMILQSVCVPVVLLAMAITPGPDGTWVTVATVLVWITVVVTAWSGAPYVLNARKALAGGDAS